MLNRLQQIGRVLSAGCAVVLLSPLSGAAQTGGSSPDSLSVGEAVQDADGNFVPDRLGDTVRVAGRASVSSGVLHGGRLSIYLQDGTGGIQLYAPEISEPIERGDRVVATGVVEHYNGQTQLQVLGYRTVSGAGPADLDTVRLVRPDSVTLEAHEGELVSFTGVAGGRASNEGGDYLWVYPGRGDARIQVFSASWRGRPLRLEEIGYGDRVEVTGLLGQYDWDPPLTGRYQVYPRTREEIERASLFLGLTREELIMAGGAAALLLLGGLGWWLYRSRRALAEMARRHEVLFDQNQAGVFRTTVEGTILDCNPALAKLYGYDSTEEIIGTRAWDVYHSASDREEYLDELKENGRVEDYLHHHRTRDGDDLWVLENARLVETEDGEREIVGTEVDLTDRVRAEKKQEAAEERYRALFEQNVAGAFRSSPDGRLLEVNPAFAEMLGYDSPEELEGREATVLYESPQRREEMMSKLEERGSLHNEELALQSKDGETVWVLENSFAAEDPETGEAVNIGTVTEITEHVREEEELEQLAHRDPLTGIPNRRFLEEAVPRMLAQAQREDECVGIVYLDLDDFKEVNDRWDHEAGDAVLRSVAERLEESIREADLVGRVGGDEFLIVLPGLEGKADALTATRRLVDVSFQEPVEARGELFPLRVTLGVAVSPEDGTDFGDLLKRADRAMYRASEHGEVAELYDDSLDQPT